MTGDEKLRDLAIDAIVDQCYAGKELTRAHAAWLADAVLAAVLPAIEARRCDALCRDVEDERDRLLADTERGRPVVEAAKALRTAQRRDVISRPITTHDLFGRAEEFRAVREAFAAAVDAYEEKERGTDE